jgi:hypothetical protein
MVADAIGWTKASWRNAFSSAAMASRFWQKSGGTMVPPVVPDDSPSSLSRLHRPSRLVGKLWQMEQPDHQVTVVYPRPGRPADS